jgi:hypothetical protein
MGNQICLRLAAPPGTEVLANEDNHILWYEAAAAPVLSGRPAAPGAGPRGMLEPAAARARVRTPRYGVPTSAMAVEQTHNRAGGAVQPLEVAGGLRALADEAGLHLHCDGARIWNASVATGVPLDRYGRLFDSLSVCFSKGLGAPVGSAVVGGRDLVDRAREVRHLYGGAMRQAGVLAAAALVALEQHVDRWPTTTPTPRPWPRRWPRPCPAASTRRRPDQHGPAGRGAFGTDGPGWSSGWPAWGAAADTDPGRVRLVFSYEVSAEDAERAPRRSSPPPDEPAHRPTPRLGPGRGAGGGPDRRPRPPHPGAHLPAARPGARLPAGRQGRAPAAGRGVQGQGGVQRPARPRPGRRAAGVLAVSSGNHGQAVALAAAETAAGRWW